MELHTRITNAVLFSSNVDTNIDTSNGIIKNKDKVFIFICYNNINHGEGVTTITVIAINNNKGGVLKTSIVTNLAGVLALNGKNVLILDCDHQGNSLLTFGKNPDVFEYTLFDVLTGSVPPERAITNVFKDRKKRGKIDVLVSNDDLIQFDFTVIADREKYPQPFYILREKCSHLAKQYDYILIDSSPSMNLTIANIFSFPDVKILIPFQCEQYSRRSLIKTLETIEDFRLKHNPSLKVLGIVPTLLDSRTTLHQEVLQDVRRYGFEHGVKVFETVIPKSVRYASSVAYFNKPLTLVEQNHKTSQNYFELLEEMNLHE